MAAETESLTSGTFFFNVAAHTPEARGLRISHLVYASH
jgi:hypothetical protein